MREFSQISSNWRSAETAQLYLNRHKIPAIWDIDTRALVRHIRNVGALRGVVATDGTPAEQLIVEAKQIAYRWPGWNWPAASPAKNPTAGTKDRSSWPPRRGPRVWARRCRASETRKHRVVAYDFGIKQNILRLLVDHHCEVIVVPAQTSAEDVLAHGPDGVFLSNGPGDPEPVNYAVENIRKLLGRRADLRHLPGPPALRPGAGRQNLQAEIRASRLAIIPVKNLLTEKVEITAQNHGFVVDPDSLPSSDVEITHVNLNDHTNEGMRHRSLPLFSVQYHPEASPGPHDSHYLFTQFTDMMTKFSQP